MEDKFQPFFLKIPLLGNFERKVEEGEVVKEGEVLAQFSRLKVVEINLAQALGVKPKKLPLFLEVGVGREVEEGQILAKRKGLFKTLKVLSPISGRVEGLVEDLGILRIETKNEPIKIRSPISGWVEKREKNFLILKFPALILPAKAAFGQSSWGILENFSGEGIFNLKDVEGKIVLIGELNLVVLNKLEALGGKGAVCLKVEKEVEEGVEESGVLVLSEDDFKKACLKAGKKAKLDVKEKRLIIAKNT